MKIHHIERALRSTRPGEFPDLVLPEIAFIGRSNVGKSSLINSLLTRKKVAATSRTPGKTRAIDWFVVDRGSKETACMFVDLPGYGYARASKKVEIMRECCGVSCIVQLPNHFAVGENLPRVETGELEKSTKQSWLIHPGHQ